MRDMEARGRSRHPRGERHGRAKLRWCDVEEIRSARACGVLVRDLAFRFGVSPAAISLAASGKNWRRK